MKQTIQAALCLTMLIITGCSELFPTSPFTADSVDEVRCYTDQNLTELRRENGAIRTVPFHGHQAIKIGLISDIHSRYDAFRRAVATFNSDPEPALLIHLGDMTETGVAREYSVTADILTSVNRPWLTVIGNHDYLSGGYAIYDRLFAVPDQNSGAYRSYTTTLWAEEFSVRIIFWDNTIWEAGNRAPDLNWLREECERGDAEADQTIVVAHINPWSDQMEPWADQYDQILRENDVTLSLHGHHHGPFWEREKLPAPFNQSPVKYRVVGSVEKVGVVWAYVGEDTVATIGGGER